MKIRIQKRKLHTRPCVAPRPDHLGSWVGAWPASGTWEGPRGQVVGHMLNWLRRFPVQECLVFAPSCFEVNQ